MITQTSTNSERGSSVSASFEISNSSCEEIALPDDNEHTSPVFDEYPSQPAKATTGAAAAARYESNLKLLLSKGSVFVVGAMLVVAAGVVSQYHPPDSIISGNFSQCSGT